MVEVSESTRRPWRRPSRRGSAVLLAGAVLAAGLVPSTSAAGADDAPLVTLVAAAPTVTLKKYSDIGVMITSLGLYGVTGDAAVELHTRRPKYSQPVVAEVVSIRAGQRTVRPVPEGLVTGLDGFTDFATLVITDSTGKEVFRSKKTWCPGDDLTETARVSAAGPMSNPYPQRCQDFKFGLGSVVGLPARWASTADPVVYAEFEPVKIDYGSYTATLTMKPAWAKVLGTPAAGRVAKTTLVIEKASWAADEAGAPTVGASLAPSVADTVPAGVFPAEVSRSLLGRVDGVLAPLASRPASDRNAPQPPIYSDDTVRALSSAQVATIAGEGRPDLKSLPAYEIAILPDPSDPKSKRQYLGFAATVWNAGPGPLVVEGYRSHLAIPGAAASEQMAARQFFLDSAGRVMGSASTGTMVYDPKLGHEHWHFLQFARYDLLDATGKNPVLSQKEAFCLTPTDLVDLTIPGAAYVPPVVGLAGQCGTVTAIAIQQRLDVGWGDTYGQVLPGQSIDVTDLPNGVYYISVTANPEGALFETDLSNNEARRKVILGGTPGGKRTVRVPPHQGLDFN